MSCLWIALNSVSMGDDRNTYSSEHTMYFRISSHHNIHVSVYLLLFGVLLKSILCHLVFYLILFCVANCAAHNKEIEKICVQSCCKLWPIHLIWAEKEVSAPLLYFYFWSILHIWISSLKEDFHPSQLFFSINILNGFHVK
jgi:hypothetical protein